VWITGFYGSAKQGSKLNSSGYSSNTGGAAIGADISIGENEANLIGLAYTNARSGFKIKQTKNDKINTNSHIFSIYGQAEIVNNLLFHGSASVLKSEVVTKSAKLVDATTYKMATGKFNSNGSSFNSLLSYKFDTNSIVLMPNIGFKYGVTFDGAYNEAGTGVYNLSITKKSSKNFSGLVGLKAMMKPTIVHENIHIIPTIDFSVEKILSHKEKNAKVKLKWADREFINDSKTAKLEKMAYNLGGSVLVKHNNKEITATYNCHLKKKYVSHQGTIKLQLLF
jgi:outer membrane autotransporter protein